MRLVIANSALRSRWLFTISYPTRAHGIIVNYHHTQIMIIEMLTDVPKNIKIVEFYIQYKNLQFYKIVN